MVGDKFRRVSAGEGLRISSATWNSLLENAERQSQNLFGSTANLKSTIGINSGVFVRVKNNSGVDVDRFCPLQISGSYFDSESESDQEVNSFETTPLLVGDTPDGEPESIFVVTQEPIEDGKIGVCCLFGMSVVNVDITHTDHTHVTLKNNSTSVLNSAMYGHRIYSVASGTGQRLAYVCLGAESCNPYKGVATEDIDVNSSGTFKFAVGNFGSLVGIGSNFNGKYLAGADAGGITDTSELFLSRVQGEWILSPVECPE